MFKISDKVICVDDTNPNPLCEFPRGYVVRGCTYNVTGMTLVGGVQIEGLPVIGTVYPHQALLRGHSMDSKCEWDVGWKPHRFRRCEDRNRELSTTRYEEQELVGV